MTVTSGSAMSAKNYLMEQAKLHPSIQPQDMIKLCYQAAFGAEHLLKDSAKAQEIFNQEFSAANFAAPFLYEKISQNCCRIHLSAWRQCGLPPEWLFRMFSSSAIPSGTEANFRHLLQEAEQLTVEKLLPFSLSDWKSALQAYWNNGGGALHHSDRYRHSEHPSYRLVCTRFIRLLPLLELLAKQSKEKDALVIALDGRAASGKTSMANQLSQILNAGIVHMDDFFLPAALRTQARLSEPGGNVHYERFAAEVLPHITYEKPFSYRRFDCSTMNFGNLQNVPASKWRLVEGAYSNHPFFNDYADIRVFCDVEPHEQMRRITLRNGPEKAQIFASRWIPLEERYFQHYNILKKASLVL